MANGQLGSLEISVLANIAGLVSDLGKAHSESTRHFKEMAREAQESIDSMKEGFKGLAEIAGVGLSLDWLKEVAAHAYEGAEGLDKMSQSLGLSVQNLQAMSFVAGATGSNLEAITGAFTKLERAGQQALAGNQQMLNDFHELGISSTELASLLKDPDKMIETVTQRLAGFRDGTAKTALTLEIMGRGAAEAIPFINEFGSNIEEAKERAREFGVLLSKDEQAALKQTQEELNLAGQAAKGMGNEFALSLAPAVQAVTKEFIKLATSDAVKGFFKTLGTDINQVIVIGGQIKDMVVDMASRFDAEFPQVGQTLKRLFADMGGDVVSFVQEAQDTLSRFVLGAKNAWVLIKTGADVIWREIANAFNAVISGVLQSLAKIPEFEAQLYSKLGLDSLAARMNSVTASLNGMAGKFKQIPADLEGSTAALAKNDAEYVASIADHAKWAQGVRDDAAAMYDHKAALKEHDNSLLNHNSIAKDTAIAEERAREAFQKFNDSLDAEGLSKYDKVLATYRSHVDDLQGIYTKAREAGLSFDEATKLQTESLNKNNEAVARQINLLNQDLRNALDGIVRKHQEELDGLKGLGEQQEIEKQYLQDLATFTAKWNEVTGGSIAVTDEMKQKLHELAAAHVAEMDATKQSMQILKDWQGIASNAFDQVFSTLNKDLIEGGSVMHDLANVAKQTVQAILLEFEKLAVINPLLNQIFGLSGSSALPTSSFGQIFNNIGGMFGGGGAGGSGGGIFNLLGGGGGGTSGTDPDFMPGGALFGQSAGNSFVGTVAPYLLLAGSAYAGINEFNAAGGGVNGAIGAATYAAGTYFAGAALATAGAIPVVGWVAIAAMLVDKFTGGNLFGTKFKPTGVTGANVDVTGSGVSITDWYQEHKHGALFSGGTYKNVDVAGTKEQQDAYNQAFDAEQKSIETAAAALGVKVGDEISGAWSETTDKTGKVVSQTTTILGQKFQEDAQHFFERLTADNELALLGSEAQQVAQQWQSSADTLMQGTAMLLAAQVDMNHGIGLLGDSDKSLADVAQVVQDLQQGGETLVQTYARLQGETQSFKSELEMVGLHINATGADFVKFADAAAQAAGGIDKLNAELTQLYQMYTPVSLQATNSMAQAKKNAQDSLSAIGEDPNESMAQFWQDFQKALPNLTPDELQKWITAGLNLGAYTNAVTNSANAMQQLADYQVQLYGDQFVSAMAGVVEWEKKQIDTANQLAQAAGKAGASQQMLAEIMTAGTVMMGKAVADLTSGIYADINTLYSALAPKSTGDPYTDFGLSIGHTSPITGPDPAAQKLATQQSAAYDIISRLGDLEYITGKSVDDILKQFNLTPEELASVLGISPDQVKKDIQSQSDNDASMLKLVSQGDKQTGLLQDLVEIAQGKTPTYDWTALGAPDTASLSGGPTKVGGAHTGTVVGPKSDVRATAPSSGGESQPVVDAVNTGTYTTTTQLGAKLDRIADLLDRALSRPQSAPPRNEPARHYARP